MIPGSGNVTAVFGGTFDPPHLGHVRAIEGLIRDCKVGRVLVLPTPNPPHKPSIATPEQRSEMVKLAFAGLGRELGCGPEDVVIDWREVERAKRLPAGRPIYSYDTLQELRREHKNVAFVIGSDQLEKLPSWHRFPDVLGLCHWIVLERKPAGHERALKALQEWDASGLVRRSERTELPLWEIRLGPSPGGGSACWLWLTPTPAPEVSSTSIREELARSGKLSLPALPPAVEAYLKAQHLYGMGAST
jgi:nicotinate-nucleotide adenylyltransferase